MIKWRHKECVKGFNSDDNVWHLYRHENPMPTQIEFDYYMFKINDAIFTHYNKTFKTAYSQYKMWEKLND